MKIIGVNGNYGRSPGGSPEAFLVADSCLQQRGRPFFIPEMEGKVFTLHPSLVLKIDRLGKNIASRFSHRYWNEWGVMLHVRCDNPVQRVPEIPEIPLEIPFFDNCVIMTPMNEAIPEGGVSFSLQRNGEEELRWDERLLKVPKEDVIRMLSRNNTLKTGDLLCVGFSEEGMKLKRDDIITIKNHNDTFYKFKVK